MHEILLTSLSFHFHLQYEFSPQTLCCYGKQLCTIPTGGTYYSYQNRYLWYTFMWLCVYSVIWTKIQLYVGYNISPPGIFNLLEVHAQLPIKCLEEL